MTSSKNLFTVLAQALGLGARSHRPGRTRRRRSTLALECLEGRTLPSATTAADADQDHDDLTNEVAQTSGQSQEHDGQPVPPHQGCNGANQEEQQAGEGEHPSPCERPPLPKPPPSPHRPPLPRPEPLRHFLLKLYQEVLRRNPDDAGLECWKKKLEEGKPREEVAQAVANSEEGRAVKVKDLFRRHLGREADEGGVRGFVKALNQGATLDQVKTHILGSEEYFAKRGEGNRHGFVKALYQDALGREVDPAGAAAWAERLARGETAGSVAEEIVGSHECQRQKVQGFYQQLLKRPADEGGLHGFVHGLQNGAREENVLCQILGSQEYYDQE